MEPSERFLNRELSWLEFNARVLALAADEARPLLERVRFVAIFARNLDDFFQVRVSGLQDQAEAGDETPSADGRTAREQLALVRERVTGLTASARALVAQRLRPALEEAGIALVSWSDLSVTERTALADRFEAQIRPVLIPLAMDPGHPFPFVSGLSLSVGAFVRRRRAGRERFARVKVPPFLPRWWEASEGRFVAIEELVEAHLEVLFPSDEVIERGHFRVTRDADLELDRRDSGDLARDVEAGLRQRQRASDAVRLELDAEFSPRMRELLMRELDLEIDAVYESSGILDLGGLFEIHRLDRPDLKETPWTPVPIATPARASDAAAFLASLRDEPLLVHHPYESFEGSVEGFLRAAAEDPHVRVLMSTIYRTGGPESGIVKALEAAAARGKQVVVMVELKARFDEAANLERARALEKAGAHVVYGIVGLKTHAKVALIVREEEGRLRRYCHIGTGNYNPNTARSYEDLGLLTCDPVVTRDVAELFNHLTSGSGARRYERLLVAPETLRAGLLERIAKQARPGGRIVLKANGLSDPELIDALYEASGAGAEIDLVIRSICCLRPGVPGLSDRIRVRSILGRFLEHSRIYRFGDPMEDAEYWIGSADLMPRNLDGRVEALVSVVRPSLRARLDGLLANLLDPAVQAWELSPDGSWKRSGGTVDAQERLMERHRNA